MRHSADFVSAGFYGTQGSIDIQKLRANEMTLHAPSGWTKERMDETLAGIKEGWLQAGALVTHRYPVDQAEEASGVALQKRKEPYLG